MMRLAAISYVIAMFNIGFLAAQSQNQYLSYQGISIEDKRAIFYEGFEDNRHKWDTGQDVLAWKYPKI